MDALSRIATALNWNNQDGSLQMAADADPPLLHIHDGMCSYLVNLTEADDWATGYNPSHDDDCTNPYDDFCNAVDLMDPRKVHNILDILDVDELMSLGGIDNDAFLTVECWLDNMPPEDFERCGDLLKAPGLPLYQEEGTGIWFHEER